MFRRLSILPSLEMMTRRGHRFCPRLILAFCNSAGKPRRTLSRFSVLCPTRTASANARWRNKCSLSSREVKSTGEKVLVVILPSTVIANVAVTKGRRKTRARFGRSRTRRLNFERETEAPATLFRFANLMLQRRNFFLHFAQFHVRNYAAGFVKEINQSAGKAADENDQETERPDEDGFGFRHSAKAVKHDLEDFFPKSNSRETDWQRRDRTLDRHYGKEIDQRNSNAQRVSGTQKSGESCKMRNNRCAEGDKRGRPMMGVKMIGSGDFDQFFATGKFFRQRVE